MAPFQRRDKRRTKRVDVKKLGRTRSKAAHHAATLTAARLASYVDTEVRRLGIPSTTDTNVITCNEDTIEPVMWFRSRGCLTPCGSGAGDGDLGERGVGLGDAQACDETSPGFTMRKHYLRLGVLD